ncbi:porin [Alkalilimnicola ehrlichii]|uniref:porin n=1 Tax=Alkalilimnicola ehrlichii TaxID=351052 RepID=UPI001C6E2379|nr:porin [Alkalilimnicola ehrlichii]
MQGPAGNQRLFGRQANIALESRQWGKITLGRQNTQMITWMNKYNPFVNANFSSIKRIDPAFADRMDNAVKYENRLGDVTVAGYYSFGWNNDQDWADDKLGRMAGGGIRYNPGALDMALLYHSKHANNPANGASSDNREDRAVAGVSLKLNPLTFYGGYRWLEQELADRELTSHLYWLGTQFEITPASRLSFAAFHLDGTVCSNLNAASCPAAHASESQRPTLLVVGKEYDFSRRTTLYTNAAYAANDRGSSVSVIGGGYGANVDPGEDQFGLIVGLRHRL